MYLELSYKVVDKIEHLFYFIFNKEQMFPKGE